ncbi:MAG: enoyl-CoA hydratase-related protein [Actinomycetota bacterium]|nr:enoyl-CoA hydratase-related protein [Actinomycetota bacterium]
MADAITITVEDHIALVTLDRPPVNAVDRATLAAIRDAFRSLDDRRDVRAAVFTATGTRAFMGGADLDSVADGGGLDARLATDVTDSGRVARDAMWAITDCAVPVVGAINGPAVGAGLAFATCCDILLAADHAWFGALEINVGLLGASAHLLQLVGRHKAREMFLLGEKVSAAELHDLGVIRQVVPSVQLLPAAMAVAARLAAKSPIAMRLAKESINRIEGLTLKDGYRTEQDYTNRLLGFEDSAEARDAFKDKRQPDWKWR